MATGLFGIDWATVDIGGKLSNALDFQLNDLLGLNEQEPFNGSGVNSFPETTRPTDKEPTITGYQFGNNVETYGLGLGALVLGFLVYKAVK